MSKPNSSTRLSPVQTPEWLQEAAQQIRVIDYELHAAIRIIGRGEMPPEHITAFMDASAERDRLMARIINHLVACLTSENASDTVAAPKSNC